ncbi:uncharacterized protein LOC131681292 [Topomyia yanbarensis]|uniref:uncharacterized protein LOC131681292 n=1 Tax=Topomyia yanbarensis TaxID=2498891 RepID=UPI00273BFA70|nr:uncharacterized protein LOC131681292 [Topomyia yanbarensis]
MESHIDTSNTADGEIREALAGILLKNEGNATISVEIECELKHGKDIRCCTEEPRQMNILDLNNDCLELIFVQFELKQLIALAKTCTRFRAIAGNVIKRNKQNYSKWIYLPRPGYFGDFLEIFGNILEQLFVSYCGEINLIVMHCTNLKELTVRHCIFNSINFDQDSSLGFESLEQLSIIWSTISPHFIDRWKIPQKLQLLDLSYSHFPPGSLNVLKNLKFLNLRGSSVTDECFSCLANNNPDLEYLNISDCNQLSAKSIQCIVKYMTKLSYLSWSSRYSEEPYESSTERQKIVQLPLLKKLVIKDYNYGGGEIDYLLRSLAKSDQLEQLELKNQKIDDFGLICNLSNLKVFKYVYSGLSMENFELAKLCDKENFIEVHISGRDVSEKQLLKFISKNPKLEQLHVRNFHIRRKDFILSVLKTLKRQSNNQEGVNAGLQKKRLKINVQYISIPNDTIQNLLAGCDHLLKLSCFGYDCSSDECSVSDEDERAYASYNNYDSSE